MKKEQNIGNLCILKVLKKINKYSLGGIPDINAYFPFHIVGVYKGGYLIQKEASVFKVKTSDIEIIK